MDTQASSGTFSSDCFFEWGDPIRVGDAAVTELPNDLYIPPDALKVFLEAFEGPLDLLLYLIRKHNIDILDIPMLEITHQYLHYVDLMKSIQLELAADYLVMAATLAEIKSRLLLPRPPSENEEEALDPRAELIRRLQEYERFKLAAQQIDALPQVGRSVFLAQAALPEQPAVIKPPEVDLQELSRIFLEILIRADLKTSHMVQKEALSVRERMTRVLEAVREHSFVPFVSLFNKEEGRMGVVVTFLAILELVKERLLQLVQTENFGSIHVKALVEDAHGNE